MLEGLTCSPGLSPRVRGSQNVAVGILDIDGSIPASAGKPCDSSCDRCSIRVYPRECGEADTGPDSSEQARGLSPRVRGSPYRYPRLACRVRSIPASAGKPFLTVFGADCNAVYPRECGEAGRLIQ